MSYLAYPIAADLTTYLTETGLFTAAQISAMTTSIARAALAASAAWEAESGWRPFLAAASASARRFDPPGPNRRGLTRGGWDRLDFDAGLVTVTSIITGFSNTDAGASLAVEDDYWLWPPAAPAEGLPYTAIELNAYQWGQPQSIQITGRWGYATTVPDDAWDAILQGAALSAVALLSGRRTRAFKSWTQAGVTEVYPDDPLGVQVKAWQTIWRQTLRRYRRPYL